MEEEKQFEIRDQRDRGWYWSNNEFLNGYVKFVGVYANGVYNSLCRHANKKQKSWPSIEMICEELGIGKNSVIESIKRLEFWQIITKIRVGKMCNNRYILNNKKEWKPINEVYLKEFSEVCHINFKCLSDKLHRFVRQTSNSNKTYSNKTHNNNSKAKALQTNEKKINDLINLFKEVNPSYQQLFKNKTQRSALERLVKQHGQEKIEWAIKLLSKTNKTKFAPVICTPLQLESKLGQLIAFMQRKKSEKINIEI